MARPRKLLGAVAARLLGRSVRAPGPSVGVGGSALLITPGASAARDVAEHSEHRSDNGRRVPPALLAHLGAPLSPTKEPVEEHAEESDSASKGNSCKIGHVGSVLGGQRSGPLGAESSVGTAGRDR